MFTQFRSRLRVTLAGAVACLAVACGMTTDASAATFTDGHWASLHVSCITSGGFRELQLSPHTSGPGIHMQVNIYINGAFAGSSGWVLQNAGLTLRKSHISAQPGTTVQLLVQFARKVDGRWQYSPNGAFEYPTHTSTWNGARTQYNGSSCRFF
jgi:hypothetical protein